MPRTRHRAGDGLRSRAGGQRQGWWSTDGGGVMPASMPRRASRAHTPLKYARYSDICTEVPLEKLTEFPANAFTPISEATSIAVTAPTDYSGVIESHTHPDAAPNARRAPSNLPESWWGQPLDTGDLYAACLHNAVCFGGRIRKTSRHWHGFGQLLVADDRYLVDD